MSFGRPLIFFLLIACCWQGAKSQCSSEKTKFQKGEGKCDQGQECSAGYECRTEVITRTKRFPKCTTIRSEVIARTEEWKNDTLRANIRDTNYSDLYTNNSWFLYQGFPFFQGPPGGRPESSVDGFVGAFNAWVFGEVSGSPSNLTVEDMVYLSDDLILGLNLIEATSYNTGIGAAYELVLWRREEGILKAAFQTLNIVPRPRPPREETGEK